jgi:hypothetical protein
MAAKKYYFGVGGGSRRFLSVVEKDGELVLIYANRIVLYTNLFPYGCAPYCNRNGFMF